MLKHCQWMATLILLCINTSLCAEADIYTWKDDDGNIHFSDRPLDKSNTTLKSITLDDSLTIIPGVEPIQPSTPVKKIKQKKTKEDKPSKAKLAQAKKCERYERRLKKLRIKMREGYSAKDAPKLLNKERALKDDINYECRDRL